MDQAGIATLAVIVVLIAAGVGTIGTPLIVDAVDVRPDSPLYSLERAGEGIKGVFVGGQDWEIERAQERDDEFVYMVDAGKADEYTWLVEESDVHLLKAAKLAEDNEGLQKAIEANVFHLVLLENVKERVPAEAKLAISFAQLQSYASVGVLENVAGGVYLKIPEPLKIELDNRLSQIRVAIENLRIENVEPLEFTIRIENYRRIGLEVKNTYTISVIKNLQVSIVNICLEEQESTLNDSGATPQTVTEVVDGNNKFAFDLYSQLAENNEKNVFFSPWSISTALAMTYEGARGQTAEEMESVLHLPENDDVRRPSFARIHNRLNENKEYELESANALWAQEGYSFLDSYFSIIENYYGGKIANLDFESKTEEARRTINDWVSEKTRGKIEELIEEGMLDPLTRLVLTNAIYFKGEWVKQFNENATHPEDFWVGPGRTVEVPMMSLTGENAKFNYMETEELKALEMPYKGEDLSMLILLPKTRFGLSDLEENINPSRLNEIRKSLTEQRVDVYMPKFEFKTKYVLSETLKEMGMVSAFSPRSADFSGMDGTRDLFMQFVIHEAFVKVDEKGTEATAATGVGVGIGIAEKTFYADHPFMFIIQEKGTGNILFLGRVVNPSK